MLKAITLIIAFSCSLFSRGQADADSTLQEPVQFAEQMPEFPGGMDSLNRYLGKKIEFPNIDVTSGIQNTRLYAEFVVNVTGKVTAVKILRGVEPEFDQHIITVLKNMPVWTPGRQNGKAFPVKMMLPIRIDLK